ncbi:HEPN domain-containing protein [Sphingomonas crocodyli]|uniref:HEPN domain-containing protein n=1 Tax=Sphingomonas crocodyli TaxID=1979270 RepID=A0A437M664_9SPHN|nr:HEPN domain-containing protein [Sphingomonas crocodyli]RVT93139.1 HEPN domain-containing protein [Sphingomonas crocodyli]
MRSLTAKDVELPEGKRRELAFVVQLLRDGFAEAIEGKRAERFKDGKLLKIILFGSYARGDWVEDPVGRYFSDYDILVVVDHEDLTDVPEFWLKTEDRLLDALSEGKQLRTPVSLIYHSLDDVNEKLRLGRYFFIDILRDGISLFAEPGFLFSKPEPLSPEQALKETQEYYEEWFESAETFRKSSKLVADMGRPKEAAFMLHQAAERFYQCLLLVRTLYSPKTHNLNRLRSQTEQVEPRLKTVWPSENKFERRCYDLLRAAYVKARYSRQYRITDEELAWLGERVELLTNLIRELCLERIETLEKAA